MHKCTLDIMPDLLITKVEKNVEKLKPGCTAGGI